jgi:hypothetical protein
MFDFQEFLGEVMKGVDEASEFKKYLAQIKADTEAFLSGAEADIKCWTEKLEKREMPQAEYESLIGGIPLSAEFRGLTEIGLKQVQLDQIKRKLAGIIINIALKLLTRYRK